MAEQQELQSPLPRREREEHLGSIHPALSIRLTTIVLLIGIPVSLLSGGILLVNLCVCAGVAVVVWRHGPDVALFFQGFGKPLREAAAILPGRKESVTTTVLAPPVGQEEEVSRESKPSMPSLPQKSLTTTTMKFDDEAGQDLVAYSHAKKTTVLDQPPLAGAPGLFSQVLHGFAPSLDRIYLAVLENGQLVSVEAPKLCHTAIAGSTGEGKSSILRMLMLQLCYINASILLLNPHYTSYDLEAKEDWTPYEPYLLHDPMESRKYEVIEYYLKQVATELLPTRMEKYAHSQPLGKPYFIVIDELPAIVKKIPDAPSYLEDILREGRKVGIFLITASQDFLVKTISPEGGGAVRDCYRTAYYVGGDATTAKKLLDIPSNQIPEHLLGKGTVMLRAATCKQASLAYVPYVDNQALYSMLGPSTYVPGRQQYKDTGDDQYLETIAARSQGQQAMIQPATYETTPVPRMTSFPSKTGVLTQKLSPDLQMALNVYEPGMSYRDFGRALGVGKDKAGEVMRELKERRLI